MTRPLKTKSPQILKIASPKKNDTTMHAEYGIILPSKSHGVPSSKILSSCFVRRRRGTIPIVAKVKNIEPKKNKNPCVCVFEVEPAGLNKFLSLSVKPPEA